MVKKSEVESVVLLLPTFKSSGLLIPVNHTRHRGECSNTRMAESLRIFFSNFYTEDEESLDKQMGARSSDTVEWTEHRGEYVQKNVGVA